jgi:O-methyltransferase
VGLILEMTEAFSAEFLHAAAGVVGSASRALNRLCRHWFVYCVMPVLNALSRRAYVQYLPDRYSTDTGKTKHLRTLWNAGRRHNNGGDHARLFFLISSIEALQEARLPGAFAELGVFKGSSARVMREIAPERALYLFDTFEGFPEEHVDADPRRIAAGEYASSLDEVRRFVGDGPGVHYCNGIFPATAGLVPADTRFALVHLDCDLYVPTRAALEFFYPRLVPGGLLILHDYHSGCWPGVTRAVDEFLADKPEGLVRIPDKSGSAALVRQRAVSPDKQERN